MWKLLIVLIAGLAAAMAIAAGPDDSVQQLNRDARAMGQVAEEGVKGSLSDGNFAALIELRKKQDDNRLKEVVVIAVMTLLSLAVVLFALRFHARTSPATLVNATSVIFIVSGTIILTLMVDTEAQLTAATGILGAVAGYVFGSMHRGLTTEGSVGKN